MESYRYYTFSIMERMHYTPIPVHHTDHMLRLGASSTIVVASWISPDPVSLGQRAVCTPHSRGEELIGRTAQRSIFQGRILVARIVCSRQAGTIIANKRLKVAR